MGFKYWYEGIMFILLFGTLIGVPCFLTAWLGSRMINDVGNAPTQAAKIQLSVGWKILIIQVITFIALAAFFQFFS